MLKRFPKIAVAAAALTLSGGLLTACGSSDTESGGADGDSPSRVVLTSRAAANVLDDLELEDRVVGFTKTGSMPDALTVYSSDDFTDIGNGREPDMDVIAGLNPDLIIFSNRSRALEPEFAKISDQVMNGDPDTSDTVASNRAKVEEIAALFGAEKDAAEQLDEIDEKITDTRVKAEGAGTALVLMTSGGKVTGYGPGTRFDIVYNELGMKPAGVLEDGGEHGAPLSWEQIAELNPDHVFVIDRDAAIGAEGEASEVLLDNPVFNRTSAATKDNVHILSGQSWYLIGGGLGVFESMIDEIDSAIS